MFGKILRTAAVTAVLMLMLPMNVFAEDVPEAATDDEIFDEDVYEEYVGDDDNEIQTTDYYVIAEDGADGYLSFYPDGTVMGYEIGMINPADEYDFPEYKGGTGTYYTDEGQIPLIENQVLCKIQYTVRRDDGSGFTGDKFYIVDYENKTLTYAGHSVVKELEPYRSEIYDSASVGTADAGLTDSPATGNSYDFIIAGIAGLAVMALTKKRPKKIN